MPPHLSPLKSYLLPLFLPISLIWSCQTMSRALQSVWLQTPLKHKPVTPETWIQTILTTVLCLPTSPRLLQLLRPQRPSLHHSPSLSQVQTHLPSTCRPHLLRPSVPHVPRLSHPPCLPFVLPPLCPNLGAHPSRLAHQTPPPLTLMQAASLLTTCAPSPGCLK